MNEVGTVRVVRMKTGERLPVLLQPGSARPRTLALRWAVRYRRMHVQAGTLVGNLRILGRIYDWAARIRGLDLDGFLLDGGTLTGADIDSLALFLRTRGDPQIIGSIRNPVTGETPAGLLARADYDQHLAIAKNFIGWCYDPMNRGNWAVPLELDRLAAERARLGYQIDALKVGHADDAAVLPLTPEEEMRIDDLIGPGSDNRFRQSPFKRTTALRNYLLYETCLGLGLRKGEALKLTLEGLPRGSENTITILRRPDDPADSRRHEPAVKTAERRVPASRALLSTFRLYLTLPPARGGRAPGAHPYVFTAANGKPLSQGAFESVIKMIGERAGVTDFHAHRLRHTWACRTAHALRDDPARMEKLQYLGGWKDPNAVHRYIAYVIAHEAQAFVPRWHDREVAS